MMKATSSVCLRVNSYLQFCWKAVTFWPRFFWRLFGPSSQGRSMLAILFNSNPNYLTSRKQNDGRTWKTTVVTQINSVITSAADTTARLRCWLASTMNYLWPRLVAVRYLAFSLCTWIVECATISKGTTLHLVSECLAAIKSSATVTSIGIDQQSRDSGHHLVSTSQRSRYRKKRLYDQRMARKARLQRYSSVKYKSMAFITALYDALVTIWLELNTALATLAGGALVWLHTATIFAINCIVFAACISGSASIDIVGVRLGILQVLAVPNGVLAYQVVRPPTDFAAFHFHEQHWQRIPSSFAWHLADKTQPSPIIDPDNPHSSTQASSFVSCSPPYSNCFSELPVWRRA